MTTFTDIFGGASVLAADESFRAVSLTDSITTVWPPYASSGNQLASIMKVDASVASKSVTLPDCRLASKGAEVLFDNCGSETFTVLDSAGSTVATITAGQVKLMYLTDNSTAIGAWRVTLLGVGSSSPDASQLVGYGLKAISNTLNFAPVLTEFSTHYTVLSSDRGKVLLWTGGSGTLTLPTTSGSTSDFSFEVRNQGTGTVTITPVGGSLIDGSATIGLTVGEACFVHMGATDWVTVGRGRSTQFNFTRLVKSVNGGTDNLTLTEASNVVQSYTGVLLSNQTVNLPAVVQVYYVSNDTTGAYTLTFGCVGGGTSVSVSSGQAAILFCDGTNIINANTSLAGGVTALVFASGSASTPSVAIGTASNGWYSPGVNELAATINGVQAVKIDSTGTKFTGSGSVTGQVESTAGAAQSVVNRAAGQNGSFRLRTAGSDRWALLANNVAEGGANAGSNLELFAYDDAGASLGSVFSIVRSTRVLTFTVAPAGLQATLVSGTNIKTVNGVSLLGSGDLSAPTGFRNRIINGGMAIDERNAGAAQTITAAAALAYCVDRWYAYCTGANVTGQRVAGTLQSQYRYQFTGAASVTAIGFAQRIETTNSYDLNGQTCMLSVDLANSLLTTVTWAAYYANTADTFGTLASPTRTSIASGSFTVTSTITRYSTSISVPSAATTGIEIVFAVGAQTSGTWTIGNAQLEKGAVASEFETRPITTEQDLCARYLPVTREYYLSGQCNANNSAYVGCSFNVTARAAPTGITLSASVGSYKLTNSVFTTTVCNQVLYGAAAVGGGTLACTLASTPLVAGDATVLDTATNRILWTGSEL